jgi:hypothetical protein
MTERQSNPDRKDVGEAVSIAELVATNERLARLLESALADNRKLHSEIKDVEMQRSRLVRALNVATAKIPKRDKEALSWSIIAELMA